MVTYHTVDKKKSPRTDSRASKQPVFVYATLNLPLCIQAFLMPVPE